jgi:hypothetical protein
MNTVDERRQWLKEHLSYELLMMRYAYKQLALPTQNAADQLAWNTNFGAFALFARNLYWFLLSKGDDKRAKKKAKASHYLSSDFTPDKTSIETIMDDLHEQVYHPGQQRLETDKKVGIQQAGKVFEWVERYMKEFLGRLELERDYEGHWMPNMACPSVLDTVAHIQQTTETTHPGSVKTVSISSRS